VIVLCEVCITPIATTDPAILHLPLDGSMFRSVDPVHGFPAPWFEDKAYTWEAMRCPLCKFRPFVEPNRIRTEDGYYTVEGAAMASVHPSDSEFSSERSLGEADQIPKEVPDGTERQAETKTPLLTEDHSPVCAACGKTLKSYAGRVAHERVCKAVPAPAPAHGDAEEEASRGASEKDITEASTIKVKPVEDDGEGHSPDTWNDAKVGEPGGVVDRA